MARKRSQVGTFGSHLQHFARSVDIVDRGTFDQARLLVCEYLHDELDAVYFELALEQEVNDAPGLKTFWNSANRDFSIEIRRPDGGYQSQLALSFGTGKPLWILSADDQPLRHAQSYQDLWSHLSDLPQYRSPMDADLYTSIIVPMIRPGKPVAGVMCFDSWRRLDIADYDQQEVIMLADALGVLLDLRRLNNVQAQGTRDAVSNLRQIRAAVAFPHITKSRVFVAFSARADQQAVGLLLDELDKFGDRLTILPWHHIDDSGTISAQLAQAITASQFG